MLLKEKMSSYFAFKLSLGGNFLLYVRALTTQKLCTVGMHSAILFT